MGASAAPAPNGSNGAAKKQGGRQKKAPAKPQAPHQRLAMAAARAATLAPPLYMQSLPGAHSAHTCGKRGKKKVAQPLLDRRVVIGAKAAASGVHHCSSVRW